MPTNSGSSIEVIRKEPPTEAERAYARQAGLLHPGMFDGEEMDEGEIAEFWLDVRRRFTAAQSH